MSNSSSSAALAAERGAVHAACSGGRTGIRELVPPEYALLVPG